jgi:hypothetical protein
MITPLRSPSSAPAHSPRERCSDAAALFLAAALAPAADARPVLIPVTP